MNQYATLRKRADIAIGILTLVMVAAPFVIAGAFVAGGVAMLMQMVGMLLIVSVTPTVVLVTLKRKMDNMPAPAPELYSPVPVRPLVSASR